MATNKRLTDLTAYKSVLPYASEIFGVYQPLIGWKGKRNIKRFIFKPKIINLKSIQSDQLSKSQINYNIVSSKEIFGPDAKRHSLVDNVQFIENLDIQPSETLVSEDQLLFDFIKNEIQNESKVNLINYNLIKKALDHSTSYIYDQYKKEFYYSKEDSYEYYKNLNQQLISQANYLSQLAGQLTSLVNKKKLDELKLLIFKDSEKGEPVQFIENPFETFDPTKQLQQVGLSPIGIVHLFRQYFYELDTFLGTPVGHVWLSPGSSVEVIESSTRRTLTERYTEYSTDISQRTETSLTEKDELSEAIKSENESAIKFGANVTAEQRWVWGEASQSASFDLNTTQKTARENSHTQMREQSSKLSSEIRKNYKSTFKTVTEITDISSKRMVLNNTTDKLINYELRRKMRQVAVQVQDIGTYLCWQTFVDRPGNDLGLSTLVHIAEKPDGQVPPPPAEIPAMEPYTKQEQITIPCLPAGNEAAKEFDGDALDEFFVICDNHPDDGHLKEDNGNEYLIQRHHYVRLISSRIGYKLVDLIVTGHPDVTLSSKIVKLNENGGTSPENLVVRITLHSVRFRNNQSLTLNAESYWEVDTESDHYTDLLNKRLQAEKAYDIEKQEAAKAEYIRLARERIKLANGIQPRKYEDLREEERIVVYRQLIKDLGKDVVYDSNNNEKNKKTKEADSDFHVFYELLNSIFDIDKMLYFVAPEWWRAKAITQINVGDQTAEKLPQNKPSQMHITSGANLTFVTNPQISFVKKPTTIIPKGNFVTWGVPRPNNYLITDDQPYPAKLGSSLGWLLQLDGDNLRNAFLNSPWVKAVIPIRPGKEKEALNWLKHVEGMNGISEQDMYQGPEPEHQGKTLLQVLDDLADKVKEKHKKSLQSKSFPENDEALVDSVDSETKQIIDDRNIVSSTPIDRVYEHGFYPLQGGFRLDVEKDFQIFDQWVEVLPTDQVVPVEVEYDPKTGRQI